MHTQDFLASLPNDYVRLYHAAQLRDLRSYIAASRVLARSDLFRLTDLEFTPFESDSDDAGRMNCADDVFGNLVDGAVFSKNGRALPNVYGPITLVFKPSAVIRGGASDIYVRQGGIWSSNPETSRAAETPEELVGLIEARRGSQEFQLKHGTLRLEDVAYVLVSPVVVDGIPLVDVVNAAMAPLTINGRPRVIERTELAPEWLTRFDALIQWAQDAPMNGGDWTTLPPDLAAWFAGLTDPKKAANLKRFADYISHGTISAMRGVPGHLRATVATYEGDDDDTELAQYEYSELDQAEMHELSEQEDAERDDALAEMWRLEQRVIRAFSSGDEHEQASAWYDYVEGLREVNRWIRNVNARITSDYESLAKRELPASDGEAALALANWADEFEELELPGVYDPEAPELPQVDWRAVETYPVKSPYDWSEHW